MSNRNRLGLRWGFGFGLFTMFIFRLLIYRESAQLNRTHTCSAMLKMAKKSKTLNFYDHEKGRFITQ